jgi:sigma-B regulation protein RsbU (phosphoserine phosphatase)
MQWSYLEVRRKLIQAELWPQGRMARLACYLAGSAVVLYALRKLLGLLAPSWGAHLGGWVGFLAFVAAVLFFILGFRWVKRRILWRLRNRLIVTYMFIGVIPAVLLVAMGLITLYGLGGQFAVFLVTSEIHSQLRSMAGVNDAVSNALAARLERGEAPAAESLAGLRKRDPAWQRRHVCAWYGNKPLPLCNDFGGASLAFPEFMKGSFQDIVHDGGLLYLRVGSSMQVAGNKLTVVTGEPFDKDLVSKIASDLGEITLYTPAIKTDAGSKQAAPPSSSAASSLSAAPDQNRNKLVITKGNPNDREELPARFTVGAVPESTGSFDREITFGTPLPVTDWKTGTPQQVLAVLQVTTRPAVLYAHR